MMYEGELSMRPFPLGGGREVGVAVSIEPPQGSFEAMPVDMTAVIDVSGSMGSAAKVEQDGQLVDVGFSVLDITKHGLRTIIASLKPKDRLCIVTFSTEARCIMSFTPMTLENQAQANALVDQMYTEDTTNLWAGLEVALGECERNCRPGAFSSIYLLTDGEPSRDLLPPEGITERLAKELERMEEAGSRAIPTISTFGFGYSLDTMLLAQIAAKGGGSFSFIPDSGFVGTVFVHALANTATTAGTSAVLNLQADNGNVRMLGGDPQDVVASTPTTRGIALGSLHYGQPRQVLIAVSVPEDTRVGDAGDFLSAKLLHKNADGTTVSTSCVLKSGQEPFETDQRLEEAVLRLEFVEALSKMLPAGFTSTLPEKLSIIQSFIDKHAAQHAGHAILVDAETQVKLAVSREDWWRRWGCSYVSSMLGAHRQQRCNNFKDQSMAAYGGNLFQHARERANDLFSNLPAPVASRPWACNEGPGGTRASFSAMFNNASNGCFHGDCLVAMADGSQKKISQVRAGDKLARPRDLQGDAEDAEPTVVCVVRTDCQDGRESMVSIGDLVLTPWHPVWDQGAGRWAFPHDLAPTCDVECESVWNLILDTVHQIEIGKVCCVTLAHGINNDPVVQHDYFGSDKVRRDLQGMPGFSGGLLHFRPGSVARGHDGAVLGYQAARLVPHHSA